MLLINESHIDHPRLSVNRSTPVFQATTFTTITGISICNNQAKDMLIFLSIRSEDGTKETLIYNRFKLSFWDTMCLIGAKNLTIQLIKGDTLHCWADSTSVFSCSIAYRETEVDIND